MIILSTDIDDTLYGDYAAMRRFHNLTIKARARGEFLLVYNTGRDIDGVWSLCREDDLPCPDAVITQCGTGIYPSGVRGRVAEWDSYIQHGFDRSGFQKALERVEEITLQCDEYQGPAKLSYQFEEHCCSDAVLGEISSILRDVNVARMITSKDKYLDIVPAEAGKANAMCYLHNHLCQSLDLRGSEIISAGDSLNDWEMLKSFKGILVNNAEPRLKHHVSLGNWGVYEAKQSYAAGVIEGLEHYGVELCESL